MPSPLNVFRAAFPLLSLFLLVACGDDGGSGSLDGSFPDVGGACVVGTLECACGPGGSCALDLDGNPLQCVAGTCLLPTCPPGAPGCDCRPDGSCGEGARCAEGACVLEGCNAGEENCGCLSDGSCEVGLLCRDGAVCVDRAGYEGGPCLGNGTCHSGYRCNASQNQCVFCDLGTDGCACTDTGGCSEGLSCSAGRCVGASELPPEDPRCYTPCRGDLPDGVDLRACSADGLLEGCIGDQECVQGSCVAPGDVPPTCTGDMDCPFFQTCLEGACYSNCTSSGDCPSGLGCHLRVCRVPCSLETGTSACDTGYTCDSGDGATGYCVPTSPPAEQPSAPPTEPRIEVDATGAFELSNLRTTAQIRLRATGTGAQRVVVRKVAHQLYDRDGQVEIISQPVDPETGERLPCEGAVVDCPLWWMEMSSGTTRTRGDSLEVLIPGNCDEDCPVVALTGAGGSPGVRYDGRFEVVGPGGAQSFEIEYVEEVAGRWEGEVHYFANFDDAGVDAWQSRDDRADTSGVRNALIQRWGALRRGNLEGWEEFRAVLSATATGSWELGRTQELCDAVSGGTEGTVCYPFNTPAGVRVYVENETQSPVPSATTTLPIAFHLRPQHDSPRTLSGRIDSASALQYPGNPAIALQFAVNPSRPGACDPSVRPDCLISVQRLTADIAVGGRYISPDGSCDHGYAPFSVPWFPVGFEAETIQSMGRRERVECRDTEVPFQGEGAATLNIGLAGANPAPDGQTRTRHMEVLDGALVNQRELFLLIRETFPSFVPRSEDAAAYGFVVMRRAPQDLADEDFRGRPVAEVARSLRETGPSCTDLDEVPTEVASDVNRLVRTLIEGSAADPGAFQLAEVPAAGVPDAVHYYCDVTGELDGGGEYTTGVERHVPHACPGGAGVRYFFTGTALSQREVRDSSCHQDRDGDGRVDGDCSAQLDAWIRTGVATEEELTFRCADPERALCNDDPDDLREGKVFFRRVGESAPAPIAPLSDQIAAAFRYKVQFQSTLMPDGEVGFAPVLCDGSLTPYCFTPAEVEHVLARIDCLISIYTDRISELDTTSRGVLEHFLRAQFSEDEELDGFERYYAELLITLGDEELTHAFASRFDVAGVATRTFEGSRFEPGGLDLTGVAGAEMQRLHAAIQYYQLALDRLYGMGPAIATALRRGSTNSPQVFISPETVSLYLTRLVRASTQKSLAWSEVGRRYLEFQQSDVARRILERAYVQTYLESIFFAQLMNDIADGSSISFQAQIHAEVERAQRAYRVAMLDMEDVFDDVVGERTFFGFPEEYVPFPAIDTSTTSFGSNGFESLMGVARQRLQIAKEREEVAIDSLTSGRVSVAQFQSELVGVRNNHEDRLADICGTFVGDDGANYPAIQAYASMSEKTRLVGEPCGFVGNGELYERMVEVDIAATQLESTLIRLRNTQEEIEAEQTRVAAQCDLNRANLDYEYRRGEQAARLSADTERVNAVLNIANRTIGVVKESIQGFMTCTTVDLSPTDVISKGVCLGLAGVSAGLSILNAGIETAQEFTSIQKQQEMAIRNLETARFLGDTCPAMTIDSVVVVANLVRRLDEIELESLRAMEEMQLKIAQVQRVRHEAARLEVRQREAEQLLINVEAARSDPNQRIYRNESVINADIAFDDAMRAAYRATRMYEYYTSTSYPRLDELFLVRLAARSRPNLENYLISLENAFLRFEEEQGLPDARVAVLSLRDDILQVPLLDERGRPIPQSERIHRMQEALSGADYLDSNGFVTIPFSTSIDSLSPLTRNHKIRYIEANVIGSDVGDRLGRIYIRQRGTGVIRTVDDEQDYYVFPERTAVVDAFFNGNRVFPPEVYQNLRLRDRPLVHTLWELVVNRRTETVNRDIALDSLSDIQILIHYTDFTAF